MRTAHPTTDPAPQPVRISTATTTAVSCASWAGPETTLATHATTATDAAATAARVRPLRDRDTSQPTSAISGGARATMASTTHSAGVGSPLISTLPPPTIE